MTYTNTNLSIAIENNYDGSEIKEKQGEVELLENNRLLAVVQPGSTVEIDKRGTIFARYESTVRSYNYARIIAQDNATVEAYDKSAVTALDESTVIGNDNSNIEGRDNSSISAFNNCIVNAYYKTSVRVYDYSTVYCFDNSVVEVYSAKELHCEDNAKVVLHCNLLKYEIQNIKKEGEE